MKKLLLLLLFVSAFAQAQKRPVLHDGTNIIYNGSNKLLSAETEPDSEATIKYTTIFTSGGSANVFIREPEGLNNMQDVPVLISYLGDGADNNETFTVPFDQMSGGPTTWTVTANNGGSARVLSTSVIIYDDGLEIGRGQIGGTITGPNLTSGSVGLTGSNSTITITSSVSLSGTLYARYTYSNALFEGLPLYMNTTETFDERGLVIVVQNRANDADLANGYLFGVVKYLFTHYDIDTDRIGETGLSRGGRQIFRADQGVSFGLNYTFYINPVNGDVSLTNPGGWITSGISSVSGATAEFGSTYTVANYSKIGFALAHGTADGILGNGIANFHSTWGANGSLYEYPNCLNLFGVGHNATLWHTNMYNRATAPWDFVDFHFKYSLDDEECATLFVEQAEKRKLGTERDIIDYRQAVRRVALLSAGAVKTALEARLMALKAELDSEIEWRVIIAHSSASISPSSGNYNVITSHVDNARIDNLINDNGTTLTGIDWFVGDNPNTSNYETEIASNRGRHHAGGFDPDVNRVGMRIQATACPVGFDGLPTGTYTLRLWHNEGNASFANEVELNATIGGVNKTQYSQANTMIGYLEWTGLNETDLANFNIGRNIGDTYLTATELIRIN